MTRNFSVVLALSALILTCGCKKSIKSDSVDLAGKAKAGFQTNPYWQTPGPYGRITRYDIGDGGGSDCLVAYDINSGMVSLTQFSNGNSTTLYTPQVGFPTDNAGLISVTTANVDVTDNYNEIGGVHIIPYDATGSGHENYLLEYVPGHGDAYLLHYIGNGQWHLDWESLGGGIGGYDLLGATKTDKIISYDYGGGEKNYLICYRPGNGYVWIIQNNGGSGGSWSFSTVQSGSGIGGFDMSNVSDQLVCIGGPAQKYMNLAAYRPGQGYIWLIAHNPGSTSFGHTYSSRSGLPGFSFTQQQDRILAISNGQGAPNVPEDDGIMFCYRPGSSIASVEEYQWNSTINPVSNSLTGPYQYTSGLNSGLLGNNPYAYPLQEGDHVLNFSGYGGSSNSSLLFYTTNGTTQSQLYYLNQSTGSSYNRAL
jgi:hypothetical protein